MGKNLNTQIWHLDSNGYTQTVRDLFTTTPPVYTHADHIDTSFNYCVNGVLTQSKRAVLHLTDRTNNVYTIENIDNTFIPNNIYDEKGNNYSYVIYKFIGTNGGVSNFAISADSQNQPSGGTYKTRVNFDYLSSVWSPRINIRTYDTSTHSVGSDNFKSLNDMDAVCTNSDALENETWWEYCARNESKYILTMDKYNDGVYITNGAFQSTSVFEGQTRAGISAPRVSWLNTPHSYGNSYGTADCIIYYGNGRDQYDDMTFDVLLTLSASDMVKKDEWDDTQYNKPRHNILFGIKIDKNLILSIISSYGLPFSFKTQTNISIGNVDYALPEIKNNTTTGNYFRGADAITADTDNNRWANTKDIDNKPAGGGGGGSEDDDYESMTTGFASTLSGCTKYYLMSPLDIVTLIRDYYTHAFAGSTLSNSIISCYLCGLSPDEFISTETPAPIKIPTVSGQSIFESANSYKAIGAVLNKIAVGNIAVPRMNNDFHDFSPYTIYEVFIPYCGWISLPDTVAGKRIYVEFHVDVRTMAGKAIVLIGADDGGKATCAEMTMNFGASTPFAVIEAGLERQAAVTAGIQTAIGTAAAITGIRSGHSALTVSSVGTAAQGIANGMMSSMANYTQVQGKAGDTSDFANGRQCYLKISWAKTDEVVNNSRFGHSVGYLCNTVGKIKDFKGLTVCANPHVNGIDCTESEKEEIKRLLEDGIIVN